MKFSREFVEAEIVILSHEDGGRVMPLPVSAYQGMYKPHIVIQPRYIREANINVLDGMRHIEDVYLGVAFLRDPEPIPISSPFVLTMVLMYAPHSVYDPVVPDAEFTIREGPRIVGHGKILKRWKE